MATTAAVIVAAGRGTRARGPGEVPKQYVRLAGAPVLAHSLGLLIGLFPIALQQLVTLGFGLVQQADPDPSGITETHFRPGPAHDEQQ